MRKINVKRLTRILIIEALAVAAILLWVIIAQPSKHAQAPASMTAKTPTYDTPAVALKVFATGLVTPTVITSAPKHSTDKRIFVVQQTGVIRAFSATGKAIPAPFLDISAKVRDEGEMGLLGLAFHPRYEQNGYIFVNYVDKDMDTIIARYTSSPQTGVADPASEKILLKIKQPYANHNGGVLAFGQDGYLYAGLGDGGSGGDPENRAQNKNELLGKILRLDVDSKDAYTIPKTNPFVGQAGVRGEIWALGMRNPWKMSFDRLTGDLYIADVGQGNVEEVNFQLRGSKGGANYGWRCYEGSKAYNTAGCQPASTYKLPIIEYGHTEGRCSITGGYVYRGSTEPSLAGKYFYADYCGGQIYYTEHLHNAWKQTLALDTDYHISTFGEDHNGELYVGVHDSGVIYRIQDTAN